MRVVFNKFETVIHIELSLELQMLALIPARGGSKRLPNKNILPLNGKPLIQHTLEVAVASKYIDRVILSTESEDIQDVARNVSGVDIPFTRPAHLAEDLTQAIDVHMHVFNWLEEHEGLLLEDICILLPTSPLRLSSDIDKAIDLYYESDADVVVSVARAKPLSWHLNMDDESKNLSPLIKEDPRQAILNHQEMPTPPVYLNGSVYVLNVPKYKETKAYFGCKTFGYEMPWSRSIDIDEKEDFEIAEALLKMREA